MKTYSHGTSHFPTRRDAFIYYRGYGLRIHDVLNKITAGEITIGIPKAEPGHLVYTKNEGAGAKRYYIRVTK
jgi:hypothetical protein